MDEYMTYTRYIIVCVYYSSGKKYYDVVYQKNSKTLVKTMTKAQRSSKPQKTQQKPKVWEIDRDAPPPLKSLGQLGPPQNICEEWYAVLLQIGHDSDGHSPRVAEPWFRVLKFCKNAADVNRSRVRFEQNPAIRGHILCHKRDTFTLICREFHLQNDPDYVNNKANRIVLDYIADQQYIDDEFIRSQLARLNIEGTPEEAIQEHKTYIQKYQDLGWVKYMRRVRNIPDKVKVIPGMHLESERMARDLRRGKNVPDILGGGNLITDIEVHEIRKAEERARAKLRAKDDPDPPVIASEVGADDSSHPKDSGSDGESIDQDDDLDQFSDEDNEFEETIEDFPQTCRTTNQTLYSMSFIMDKSDDMDCLLFIHAYYPTEAEAKKHICADLDDRVDPLQIHGLDMYKGIFPVRMLWESDAMSSRVKGMVETWTDVRVSSQMQQKYEATREQRVKKHDAIIKQKREQDVIDQINDRLDINTDQQNLLFSVLDSHAVMDVCRIDDPETRHRATVKLLKRAGKISRARDRCDQSVSTHDPVS